MSSEGKFTYLSNIAYGVRSFDLSLFDSQEDLYRQIVSKAIYPRRTRAKFDNKSIEILLRNSWQTEIAARWPLDFGDTEVRRVMSHTLPMHVYYSLFNAARATALVEGLENSTHDGIQNDFRSNRMQRATGSWSYWSTGDPRKRDSILLQPGDSVIPRLPGLSLRLAPLEYLSLSMLTSRNFHIDYKRLLFLKAEKLKRLRSQERVDFFERNPKSSLLDLVYQLRCRANYEEIDEYGSAVGDDFIDRFYTGLLHICFTGLLHYEAMIASRIGIAQFANYVDCWTAKARLGGSTPMSQAKSRLEIISSLLKK